MLLKELRCDEDSNVCRGGSNRVADRERRRVSKGAGEPFSDSSVLCVSLSCQPGEGCLRLGSPLGRSDWGLGGNVYVSDAIRLPLRSGCLPLAFRLPESTLCRRPVATRRASSSSSTLRYRPAISARMPPNFRSTMVSTVSLSLSCCCVRF